MTLVVTIQRDKARLALLGPLMVVTRALTRVTGIWAPGPGITLNEGEEGVAVEIENLTGVDEVVVKELRSIRNKDSRLSNGAVPTTTHPA